MVVVVAQAASCIVVVSVTACSISLGDLNGMLQFVLYSTIFLNISQLVALLHSVVGQV